MRGRRAIARPGGWGKCAWMWQRVEDVMSCHRTLHATNVSLDGSWSFPEPASGSQIILSGWVQRIQMLSGLHVAQVFINLFRNARVLQPSSAHKAALEVSKWWRVWRWRRQGLESVPSRNWRQTCYSEELRIRQTHRSFSLRTIYIRVSLHAKWYYGKKYDLTFFLRELWLYR